MALAYFPFVWICGKRYFSCLETQQLPSSLFCCIFLWVEIINSPFQQFENMFVDFVASLQCKWWFFRICNCCQACICIWYIVIYMFDYYKNIVFLWKHLSVRAYTDQKRIYKTCENKMRTNKNEENYLHKSIKKWNISTKN